MSRIAVRSGGSLLGLAYLAFISLGLPDALLGVGWPSMRTEFGVSIEAVGLILTVGVTGYLLSSVSTGFALARLGVGRLLAASTALVALGLAVTPPRRCSPWRCAGRCWWASAPARSTPA
jgi:fucose permease